MAPGFLSRFVKASSPTSHTRDGSEPSRSSTSSQRSHKSPPSTPLPDGVGQRAPTPSRPGTPNSATPPTMRKNTTAGMSNTSLGSGRSWQPNVTIIPPSPSLSSHSHSDSNLAESSDRYVNVMDKDAGELTNAGRTTSPQPEDLSTLPSSSLPPHSSPAPTPSKPPASAPRSRPVSPLASTAPLPSKVDQQLESGNTSSSMPKTPEPSLHQVRHSPSNRSLNLNTNSNHSRSATAETPRESALGENGTMSPIVESPTSVFPSQYSTSEQSNGSASLLSPRDSDAVSVMSTATNGGTKEKKRPWKRSTTRKPTGLAGAIAASGMAMAQPTLSAAQKASFSNATMQAQQPQKSTVSVASKKSSAPGSPPYSTRSPPGSNTHVKGKSADLSPTTTKSKRPDSSSTRSGVRRTSISIQSDNASEYYPDDRPEYYSGLDASSDEEDSADSESILDGVGIPVTGFAVASNKRNADFHELFPNIPEGDYLIEDYGCALQRDILIQGRLYISENHICFHANIFGWITDLSIPMYEITHLEKRMTAFVIPNAIQITTRQAKYVFASFLSRDTTYDVIYNIWRLARPDDGINSSRPSFDTTSIGAVSNMVPTEETGSTGVVIVKGPKVTSCACGKDGHYSETALDCILPGTPDRIHNLIFASGFMKEFMVVDQKLTDIQMSDWLPTEPRSNLLTRNMSYIKPLYGSIGPKQTKCEIKDEMIHNDPDQYIMTVTTTRTPDVPSGGVFSVKTKTCIMWASSISTRVIITTQVEWTGRSFIRSIIEKSAIDGQKTYHLELEKAMRAYIQEHQSEFIPEGIDTSVITEVVPSNTIAPPTLATEKISSEEANKRREKERNQRGLQWAWDTFEGASQVAIRSTKGALELIRDAWEQSSSTTIMWFVIVALVISNLWSLILMGSREEAGRRKEMRKMEEREKWVQGVVTALWDEMGKQQQQLLGTAGKEGLPWVPGSVTPPGGVTANPVVLKKEIGEMEVVLEQLEERIKLIKQSLNEIKEAEPGKIDEVD